MKTNLLYRILIIVGVVIAITMFSNYAYAASVSIAAGSTSLTVGSSTTLTIRGVDLAGRVNITSSNPNVISIDSASSGWVDPTASQVFQVRVSAKSAGTSYITVTTEKATTTDQMNPQAVSASAGVNLTAKAVVVDTRSSNNYLSSLNIEGYELSPAFNANTNNYTMNVGYDVSSLNVSAVPADNRSRTVVEGNLDLVAGENNVTVTVTAENGYKRVYTITVTKEKNPDDIDATIESLVINNAILKNEFASDVVEYMCDDITADIEKLDITVQTKIPEIKYEIIGNDELKQGINHVVIKVTSRDGSVTKEYEIIVFKTDEYLPLEDVMAEPIEPTFYEVIMSMKTELMIAGGVLLGVIVLGVIIIVVVKKKSKKEDEEVVEVSNEEQTDEENITDESIEIEEETTEIEETTEEVAQEIEEEKQEEIEKPKTRKGRLTKENKKEKSKKEDEDLEEDFKIKLDLPSLNDNEEENKE